MKALFLRSLLLFIVLNSLVACQDISIDQAQLMPPNRSALASKVWAQTDESAIALIYDYSLDRAKLEYRAVRIEKSSGDPLKDALKAFFQHNSLRGNYQALYLDHINTAGKMALFSFGGHPEFHSADDRDLFYNSLEMTIARHYKNLNFKIQLEEDNLRQESRVSLAQ